HGAPRPACGERATRHGGKPELDAVRGPLHDSERLRLAEAPPHPDLLPARGEKEPKRGARLTNKLSKSIPHRHELLHALSGIDLAGVQVALGVHGGDVDEVELAAGVAVMADLVHDLAGVA